MSRAIPTRLYHYTCDDHGRPGIEAKGYVLPYPQPLLRKNLAWFTDLALPDRWALGLTNENLCCNRVAYRVTVHTFGTTILPWWHWRHKTVDPVIQELLETVGFPMHWWVSEQPVAAEEITETRTLYAARKKV